ncbi:hypothetical protein [Limnohabitans lacus]|uniref:Tip attachment protein J domain-containing protein n=1 Tax=Limnohabitans lacus TaxID=3045173 RepID=A0ABT6XAN0_9BURK|nr:hypothetical protein [Limnohabitans sp. HM2-2]MDI9235195.1 hypothetical protein [Limnohabitans sp. HM2-2]
MTSETVAVNFGGSKLAAASANQQQKVADVRPMAVSVRDYGMGTMSKAEMVTAAKAIMSPTKANQIATIIKGVMSQGKVGSGVFIYEQQVRPRGATRDMKLSWGVTVTETGHVFAGDPKVVDPDPTTVYMLYTSLAAEAGLPQTWTYADAGVLKWQLRKLDGTPATAWTTINTGGAFDESGTDSEFKVNCLANKLTSGCPTAYVDAKALMAETASVSAMIDYVRKVAPAYNESQDPSTGETIYQPQISVSYDRREYDRTGCSSGNFRNIGRRGYTLKTTVDRYQMVETDSAATRVNRFEGSSISPTENFDVSKTLDMTSQSLSNQVIDSFSNALVPSSSVLGLQYMAPITTYSTLSNANNMRLESTQSDMAMSWVPGGNGTYSLYLGTIADNYWGGYGAVYDRSMTFNISNKDLYSKFTLAQASFDDWLMLQVNGNVAYVGPYGGDRLSTVSVPYTYCGGDWGCETAYELKVQYGANAFGWPELSTNWSLGLNVDLRPYLRAGQNTIFMRTIVAGRGEGAIRIDATSCLAD